MEQKAYINEKFEQLLEKSLDMLIKEPDSPISEVLRKNVILCLTWNQSLREEHARF